MLSVVAMVLAAGAVPPLGVDAVISDAQAVLAELAELTQYEIASAKAYNLPD
jgi:hypothetical protein